MYTNKKIVDLGLDVKEIPNFEVFDPQLPFMVLEIKKWQYQMSKDKIRVYMLRIESPGAFIKA